MIGGSIFVGRQSELAELAELARERAPIVTLWGPGGAGKTRLAREQARREEARGTRVAWAELEAARTPADVAATIASALGVSIEGRDAPAAILASAAAAQEALVVADNVEQIDREGRALLVNLARTGARVLVTSREALGAPEERTIAVGPLPEPDALALFGALAGGAREAAARAIVQRLDAMPLAIELAAARVPLLGADELLARLDRKLDVLGGAAIDEAHRPARHATLRAAIAWSWDLLEDDDRLALAACATFEAPFDAPLAEQVMPLADASALDALDRLRRRALLHAAEPDERGRPTLHLLESVRDFVREVTRGPHTPALEEKHAAAVVARSAPLAEDVARGAAVPRELLRRRADLAAIARRMQDTPIVSARAALALAILAGVLGPLDVAIEAAEGAASAVRTLDPALAARLDLTAAEALRAIGRPADALPLAERALASGGAEALRVQGSVRRALGDPEGALADVEEALAAFRAEGDRAREAMGLGEIGAILQSRGRLAEARERHAQAIAIHVALGSRRAEGVQRSYLAVATHRAGDPAAAVPLHEQALAIHREVGHLRLEGAELLHLGFVHHELGSPGRARQAFDDARTVLARAGARGLEALALVLAARLDVDEGALADAMVRLAQAAEHAPRGWARLEATRRLVEGHLAMARGDAAGAAVAYEASLAASGDVEVGFEALTPAYLALAWARLGRDGSAALAQARARIASFENPHLPIALEILAGGIPPSDAASLPSSEVRRALAFAGRRRALRVTGDVSLVVLPDGRRIDLSRRKNVRLVLRALVDARRARPGEALDPAALVAAGWPGERMRADAATKRLHTAIWTLRSLGLGDVLLTEGEGYRLDPSLPVDIVTRV